jgi:hypothetical protein
LHTNMLSTSITSLARERKKFGNEIRQLRRRDMNLLSDVILHQRQNLGLLIKIVQKDLVPIIRILARQYRDNPVPQAHIEPKLKDNMGRWVDVNGLTSKTLREILFPKVISHPKIVLLDQEEHSRFFANLGRVVNVKNKTCMLRLLYGDVYCAERLVRFGMSENDRCRRCFEKETIIHLLMDCPYSRHVHSLLRINSADINDVLGINLNKNELEIRCDFINYLVFRQQILPPEILVKTTLDKFSKGLVNSSGVEKVAKRMLRFIE